MYELKAIHVLPREARRGSDWSDAVALREHVSLSPGIRTRCVETHSQELGIGL
jgi:hypothetical protein